MRSQEFTGKTTQEAIDNGLAALGVTIADVHVDVLQEGAKGLFGLFGSKPARVRLTVMEEEKEEDQGLRDLLGSFSLNEPQRRKNPPRPARADKRPEETPREKAQGKKSAPAAGRNAAEEAASAVAAPVHVKEKEAKQTEKTAPALFVQKDEGVQESCAAAKAEAAQESDAQEEAVRPTRPKKERKPRPPREKVSRPQKNPEETSEERTFAPMAPAEPFAPTEPPVLYDENTPAGRAQRFLMDVTERMHVKVDVYVDASKEDSLYIHMIGDTLGILIGRRGETLDALQYLTSLQVNKGRDGYIRVTLDTENYRAKREDSLRRLAQRMANRAQKTGRKVVLEPMNPYERRVLHTALQNHPAVTTHSEGEEPNRRVVILLKNQPPRAAQAESGAVPGEKSASSRRGRGRRRGPRKNAAVQAALNSPAQTDAEAGSAAREPVIAAENPPADGSGVEE
ncbi:MAG TPA: Jag N-terminal domain-containing protein [Candidatus Ventricola intestinavium]|nr:Jag N-terminal domain-containing protein [Candidatus Ventricola intestinavium]